ncbi:GAF domain-containing protein [Cetobacterium sp. SF1]|uniref:GAF domain-containing protein n=1 Tax=unclassified Cetobacterium TaxID=2630983 RepID=UPI003CED4ADA
MAFNIDFYKNMDQEKKYQCFLRELEEYLKEEKDSLANLCNTASFIGAFFENLNWSGFYLYKENQLILGPFCGFPATTRIEIGKGVCGTAFEKRETLVVDNVCEFPGHITCDVRSKSEVVIPLINGNEVYGVLDIDSSVYNRFSKRDVEILEKALEISYKYIDYKKIIGR